MSPKELGMDFKTYHFKGYQGYDDIAPQVESSLNETFGIDNWPFLVGLNEAILNAAKYGMAGLHDTEITLSLRLTTVDCAAKVEANTKPFDAFTHKMKLLSIARDPIASKLPWGKLVGDGEASRGIWHMLYGSDYVIMDSRGQDITLAASVPPKDETREEAGILASRFFVRKEGVIL